MKKIAIMTIVSFNYGNKLQNYAAQEVYKELGLAPETIKLESESIFTIAKHTVRDMIKKDRYANFRNFDKNIIWSKYNMKSDIPDEYDYYSIGSDQVWNPTWYEELTYRKTAFLLSFAPPEKRITMSPSFGISQLPEKWEPVFAEELKKFNKISVREEAGAEIVRKLTGKEAQVLVDPTLMLDREKWLKVAKKPVGFDPDKPYILTYFLGGRSERAEKEIARYAKKNGFKVYHLLDSRSAAVNSAGPGEFIYLIAHASLVMTDSFHACVFSFLFERPFKVYPREGGEECMISRINTLLGTFRLERKFSENFREDDILENDYSEGYEILKKEQEKMKKFLSEQIDS